MANLHTEKRAGARARTIKVRDVARKTTHELGPSETMYRVPYDLFNPPGPVQLKDELISYVQSGEVRTGRAVKSQLGESRPGERVLLRLEPCETPHEWWLCEVVEVEGVSAD